MATSPRIVQGVDECIVCASPQLRPMRTVLRTPSREFVRCASCGHVAARAVDRKLLQDVVAGIATRGGHTPGRWLLEQLPTELRHRIVTCVDIGTWTGDTLVELPAQWGKAGLEPNAQAAAVARDRGLDVTVGAIESAPFGSSEWDLVTMLDVLEHLPDPKIALVNAARLVSSGGVLVVLTGNAGCLGAAAFGADWYYLHYPEHVSFFTAESLSRILTAERLRVTVRRVRHPLSDWRQDLGRVLRRPRASSEAASLQSALGPNAVTASRLLRGRDHLLVLATRRA